MLCVLVIMAAFQFTSGELSPNELQLLNHLPLDKLLQLKNSLQDLVTTPYANISTSTPSYLQSFGAQALAMKAPKRRTDYEEGGIKKHGYSKISNIFSMSITTLAFLAFGGYLLCLIVQAVRQKQNNAAAMMPTAVLVNAAGIKKRPQSQFSQYGRRRRRDNRELELELSPEQMFSALMQLCEGYAKWSGRNVALGGL